MSGCYRQHLLLYDILSSSPPRHWCTDKRPPCGLHARPLPLRRRYCALLHARARSLCHRAEPSPPSLSPCTGPRCPHTMRGYKRDLPRAFCLCLWFHRPQVPEHPTTSEQLSEAWPTSPTTSEQLPEAWQTSPPTLEQLPEAWPTSPTTSEQLPEAWPEHPITSEQLPEARLEHLITSE
jgi:hypothetical protein